MNHEAKGGGGLLQNSRFPLQLVLLIHVGLNVSTSTAGDRAEPPRSEGEGGLGQRRRVSQTHLKIAQETSAEHTAVMMHKDIKTISEIRLPENLEQFYLTLHLCRKALFGYNFFYCNKSSKG